MIKDFCKKLLAVVASRKFWVFVAGTVLLFVGKIESWAWLTLAGVYMGANVVQKIGLSGGGSVDIVQHGGSDQYVDGTDSDEMEEAKRIGYKAK